MTGLAVLAAVAAAGAGLLLPPARPRPPQGLSPASGPSSRGEEDLLHRWRAGWAIGIGLAGLTWVPPPAGVALGGGLALLSWVLIGRSEPARVRRARQAVRTDLPHLVTLWGATLRAGASPGPGLEIVCEALPGPAADRLGEARARLALGVDPATVWAGLSGDDALASLGRCLARAQASGAPVADAVDRLAQELARERRADVEDRARTVGVKAAVPLGVCLLPAFLLLGVVPVVAALLTSILG